ncbi:phage holin family protein [Segetibacter sp. 3557_3]|uniref:phage holin family protein n=1 Tax=Segetibacter sp. 3557_3 TaxID=2547429 RepID=UPI0014045DD0|nr:phage holin family protein [Segetibacter sp. 3557_3]
MAGFLYNLLKFVQSKDSKMETEKTFFEDVQQRVERYVQDRLLLAKLEATEKIAGVAPKMFLVLALAFIGFFIVMIASFLLGYFFSLLTGSVFAGFGIILGIYIVIFFVMILLYKRYIKQALANMIVKMMFSKSNGEVHHDA